MFKTRFSLAVLVLLAATDGHRLEPVAGWFGFPAGADTAAWLSARATGTGICVRAQQTPAGPDAFQVNVMCYQAVQSLDSLAHRMW